VDSRKPALHVGRSEARSLFQVLARREGPVAAPRNHHRANGRIGLERRKGGREFPPDVLVDGVHRRRTVQADERDFGVALDQYRRHYFALMNAMVVSSIRLEKPHSLSYQPPTFTSMPSDTLVMVASNVHEAGLWL